MPSLTPSYQLDNDDSLANKYHEDPGSCDLAAFLVPSNGLTMTKSLSVFFWKNILGFDVDVRICFVVIFCPHVCFDQDNYRIIFFDKHDCLSGGRPLKTHLVLSDGPDRPNDQFLRAHFERCLAVSTFGGDPQEDYDEQEISNFMEELGIYDVIDWTDPRWQTELGIEVRAWLLRSSLQRWVFLGFFAFADAW
jgi:hypothetical protein